MLSALFDHIAHYTDLNEGHKQILSEYLIVKKFKRKQLIFEEGSVCKSNYFVVKGCARSFFVNEKGNEQLLQFAIENWWISDYQSYVSNARSSLNIQAIEDVIIIEWNKQDEDFLYTTIPQLESYFRMIYQKIAAAWITHVRYLMEFSKESLYRQFVECFPEFIERIPNYMLASYLGITPEYLSELRRKIIS